MATVYSNNAYLTNKVGGGNNALPAIEAEGRVKASAWFFAVSGGAFTSALDGTAATFSANDTAVLAKIPAGSKILKAVLLFSATQTTAQYSVGLQAVDGSGSYTYSTAAAPTTLATATDSTTVIKAAAAYGTTGDVEFNIPSTGLIIRSDVFLTITNSTAAPGAANCYGYVIYTAP